MTRTPVEQKLTNTARRALAEAERFERRRDEAAAAAETARAELTAFWQATCDRFGLRVPADALLLDVLASITIEDDAVWRWGGLRNNKGLPTIRPGRGAELSLVRYLAIQFGVISEEEYGVLYPANGDPDDVNPWHRVLRVADGPIGNRNRYDFTPQVPA